jgi:hypothetical protein
MASGSGIRCARRRTDLARIARVEEALSRKEGHVGAVAFSRTGDPATGDFSDAKVVKKFGDVPDDLSAL